MRLFLMQHGEAKSKEEDPDRPLTERGRAEVEAVARLLSQRRLVPRVAVFHSGKTRAKETAEILASTLNTVRGVTEWEGLQPMDEPGFWAASLGETEEDTVLVGHLPHLSRLAALLLACDVAREPISFRMGAMLGLERRENEGWSVLWYVTPEVAGA